MILQAVPEKENIDLEKRAVNAGIMVFTEFPELEEAGRSLAKELEVPFAFGNTKAPDPKEGGLFLHLTREGLALEEGGMKLLPDFSGMRARIAKGKLQQEFLAKASKIKGAVKEDRGLYAIDATAGLGEDSFILAAAGYRVLMYERDPVIALLLEDALERARKDPELKEIAGRMQVERGDSIIALRKLAEARKREEDQQAETSYAVYPDMPDLIYLDPMFPKRRKSGLIGKKLQLLQKLEQPCMEEAELLEAALAVHPRRIVIKRPLKGPFLSGKKPQYSLEGKAVRFDVMIPV